MFSRTEAEEEGLINRLMKRLSELKKEKENLAIEVEREEEVSYVVLGANACVN